jgi:transcriptional regulator with XRE-family HTH domain
MRTIKLMTDRGITQYRLEQDAGIFHGAMDRILQGKNKTVSFTTIFRLARGFKMTLDEFLDDVLFRNDDLESD